MRADPATLERAIGHEFADREIFRRALTHISSAESESAPAHNEQLEFLGDAVLGFLLSEALVQAFPSYREGRLSKLKAHFASATHLAEMARRLDLGAYLELGKGEEVTGGRAKTRLLANGLEAVIAALYLDGGMETARQFVARFVLAGPISHEERSNRKGELQEFTQSRGLPLPHYELVATAGPDHARKFTVEVRLGNGVAARGEGASKKAASQQAAKSMLERLLAPVSGVSGGE